MNRNKRSTVVALLASLAFSGFASAQTSNWPNKPVKFVVGAAAGGSASDAATRFFAKQIGDITGQTTIVENKPGADGNLAAVQVQHSPPDGYTVMVTGNNTHAANVHLYKSLPYDPEKDFAPVTTYAKVPYVLLINPQRVAARTLKDFVSYAKANPGKLSYASASVAGRVGVEQLKRAAGFDALNVNYKSGGQAMTDLLGGQVDFYMGDAANALVQARTGKVVALAVSINERLHSAPDIPTIAELGFPDYDFFSWLAVWAPAGSPPDAVRTLSDLINKSMSSPAGKQFLENAGLLAYPGSPESLRALQKRETERWGTAIKAAGMELK